MSYDIDELRDVRSATIAPFWEAVERRCPDASLFVRWPWVDTWLATYGAELRPRLLLIRRRSDSSLAAVALVGARREWRRKVFSARQLLLGTTGEPAHESVCVEFNQLLAPTAERAACSEALLRHLCQDPDWDELLLTGFLEEDLPRAPADLPLHYEELRRRPCHAMDLAVLRAARQRPEQVLSGNTRHQISRSLRLYGAQGKVLLSEPRDAAEALEFLDELIALHERSWLARGEDGVFRSPRMQRFHRALIPRLFPQRCQLLRVQAGAETVGVVYNLLDHGTVYFYQSGLCVPQSPKEKPGLCVHLMAMEHNLRLGMDRYEFMASDARYKRSLSNTERTMVWGVLQRPRLSLLLERAAVSLVRRARQGQAPAAAAAAGAEPDR